MVGRRKEEKLNISLCIMVLLRSVSYNLDVSELQADRLKHRFEGYISCFDMYKATLLKLADLDKRDAEAAKVRARIRWAEEGEMSSLFSLRLEKRNGTTNWFSAIRNDDGVVVSDLVLPVVSLYADDTSAIVTSDAGILAVFDTYGLFEKASGSKLNLDKCKGLWLGSWRNRLDAPISIDWSLVCHGALLTVDRLISFGHDYPPACFCFHPLETAELLFFHCPLARSVWIGFNPSCSVPSRLPPLFCCVTCFLVSPQMNWRLFPCFCLRASCFKTFGLESEK